MKYTLYRIGKINQKSKCLLKRIKSCSSSLYWNQTHVFTNESSLSSQVILDDVQGRSFLAKVLDNDARAAANLPRFALLVNFTETAPFAQLLAAVDADQWNLMFTAQGGDELLVLWLVAALSENAQDGLTSRKRTICH